MARIETTAQERTHQNHRLREEVSIELGVDNVTLAQAQQHRRAAKKGPIPARDIDFTDIEVQPLGVFLGAIDNYKVLKGGAASLNLRTDSREFGDVLHDAARISEAEVLVVAVYRIPRHYGLGDGDEDLAVDAAAEWELGDGDA